MEIKSLRKIVKLNILKVLTFMFLFLIAICFITSDQQEDSVVTYQMEVQIPSEEELLWDAINNMATPILSVFTLKDETIIYGNDEYYLANGYKVGEEYKNYASTSENYKFKSYYQKYILSPLDNALSKRDWDSLLLLFQTNTEDEFIDALAEISEDFKVVSYGNYVQSDSLGIFIYITLFEFMFLMLVFLLTLYEKRETFSCLKGIGISKFHIILFQLKKNYISFIIFSMLLVIANMTYLVFRFSLSTTTIEMAFRFFLFQLLALVVLYIAQIIVMIIFLSTRNFVNEIKIGKDYNNIQSFFIFFSFFSKVLFVCFILFFSIQIPQIVDMSKVYLEWGKVNDYSTVIINNFNYLNGEKNYDADYNGVLDDEERMNVVHYFEQNYSAAYIVGDKENFVPANNGELESSFLQANYNYLKLVEFPEYEKISNNEDVLLVPRRVELNSIFYEIVAEKYSISSLNNLKIIQYDDFKFYSYDTRENFEVGNNGFFENPLLFIPSNDNSNAELYTIPFQEFFYLDSEVIAVNEYYRDYNIEPENETNSYSKYAEYSTQLHSMILKLSILLFNLVLIVVMYVITSKISLDVYIKTNAKLLSIWTIIGLSNFSKYKYIYLENTILSLVASLLFFVGMITTSLDAVLLLEFIIFIFVDTLFIMYVIKRYEMKSIVYFLKGGA